jgi:hypothetical protein
MGVWTVGITDEHEERASDLCWRIGSHGVARKDNVLSLYDTHSAGLGCWRSIHTKGDNA